MKQYLKLGVVCVATCLTVNQVWAGAFANKDLTASGAGVANAVVAGADDISAAIYNPAGLAWQPGVQAMLGSQLRYRTLTADVNAVSQSGGVDLSDLTLFAISWLPENSDWGISGSISTPYSSHTKWASTFPGVLDEININMERYSANTFWRINNSMAISLGVDSYNTKTGLNSNGSSFSASAWSDTGVTAGLRWEIQPFWVLGVNIRKGSDVTVTDQTGSRVDIFLPDEVTVALAHDLIDDEVRLELDLKQTNWSSFADMVVSNNGVVSQNVAMDLSDTTDVAIGATWFWRNETQFRFGYAYEQGANNLSAFQPAISDQVGHRLSAGFGGAFSGMHLDVAYSAVLYPDVDAKGVYAGTYSDFQQNILFSVTKKF